MPYLDPSPVSIATSQRGHALDRPIAAERDRCDVTPSDARVVTIAIPPGATPTVVRAVEYLAGVARLLLAKNQAYGDSAAKPMRIFSRVDAATGVRVRIDDKLS